MLTVPSVRSAPRAVVWIAGATFLVASSSCGRDKRSEQTSAGAIDTTSPTTSATPALGPGVYVTRTDAGSVRLATQLKLSEDNFGKFMRAADSVASLQARDRAVREYLSQSLSDAGSKDVDAGLKWLEASALLSNAIASAGLSTKDYYVIAIAIAGAEQYIPDPATAPPTPVARDNAEFLRGKSAELARLKALQKGDPAVTVRP